MIHLVTGGSGSGKSSYAEECVTKNKGSYVYIATMQPFGKETVSKIERHQRLRAGKGFVTLERYTDLGELSLPANDGVLLECMSNLAANEFYREVRSADKKETALENSDRIEKITKKIVTGIRHISGQTPHLVIVTNEVFSDNQNYSRETRAYMLLLGNVNQQLASLADQVTEVVYGIPLHKK